MKIVAVVGSGSNAGKTTLACLLIGRIPGLGAVKISPCAGTARIERGPGRRGKDTARFAAAGASPVARIVAAREQISELWKTIKPDFADCAAVVIEGAGGISLPEEKFAIFVCGGGDSGGRKERADELIGAAQAILINDFHRSNNSMDTVDILSHNPDKKLIIEIDLNNVDDPGIKRIVDSVSCFLGR